MQGQWAKTAKDAMVELTARWDVDAAYTEGGQKTSRFFGMRSRLAVR